jgi:hypothetical protein
MSMRRAIAERDYQVRAGDSLRLMMAVVGSCLEVTSLTVGETGADAHRDGGSIPCDTHRNFENRNYILSEHAE